MDQTEFQAAVKEALDKGIRLTQRFEVVKSTVKKWAAGVVLPNPLLQALIVRYIREKLEKLKKSPSGE